MSEARIVYVADVFCPWCYAFAPNIERLAKEFPEFSVQVVGGNLISRPMTLVEDLERSPDLIDFWRDVERASGRSLEGAISAAERGDEALLFSPGADEILIELKKFAPGRELEQLIYLENLFYGEGRNLFAADTLAEIALEWGVKPSQFERALNQPEAFAATERNLEKAARLMGEINTYPSVLLVKDGKTDVATRGFVRYETVLARFESAMADLGVTDEAAVYCSHRHSCSLSGRNA